MRAVQRMGGGVCCCWVGVGVSRTAVPRPGAGQRLRPTVQPPQQPWTPWPTPCFVVCGCGLPVRPYLVVGALGHEAVEEEDHEGADQAVDGHGGTGHRVVLRSDEVRRGEVGLPQD